MINFVQRVIMAWRNQSGPSIPREERRRNKKLRGRITPNGKYFGGVEPNKKQKEQRFIAGKVEKL